MRAHDNCVELVVQGSQMTDIFRLFDDCINGKLGTMFEPVQEQIRKVPGFEKCSMEIVLFKDAFDLFIQKTGK